MLIDASGIGRRLLLRMAGGAFVALLLTAHTPYGQWTVYRQRNLFIVASRTDPHALDLARTLVRGLARELPQAHARVTRATDTVRIASLLATRQIEIAIVSADQAPHMLRGTNEFKSVGPIHLRLLVDLGDHLMVSVLSFSERHAFLVTEAVEHLRSELPGATASSGPLRIPPHPGAAAYHVKARESGQ